MKNKVHLKTLLVGILTGIGLTFTLGASLRETSGPVGRFQIAGTHSHALVVDTKTGQVWRGFFPTGNGNNDSDFLKPKLGLPAE
jgi:hypothetical protein